MINVYLIGRIAEEYHPSNERLGGLLDNRFEVFMPHKHNPYNVPHNQLEAEVARIDYDAIERSQVGLINTAFGEDCSCEIGYYFGSGKPTVLYAQQPGDWLKTWMAKYAITAIAVPNQRMASILRKDRILGQKEIRVVKTKKELSD